MFRFYVAAILSLTISTNVFGQPAILKDINVETAAGSSGSIGISRSVSFKNRVYFPAYQTDSGCEIFVTDGTTNGTVLLKEIYPGQHGIGNVVYMGTLNDYLLFAFTAEDGDFLYSSNGTAEGTEKIAEVQVFSSDGYFKVLNDVAYFAGFDDAHGWELWRTDGTTEGTFMVKDIVTGPGSSAFGSTLFVGDDEVYFSVNDGVNGPKTWVSDGTEAGTNVINGLTGGLYTATLVGNTIYVISDAQIIKSDGTEEGTVQVTNFGSGNYSYNERLLTFGNKILFRHSALDTGTEWWILNAEDDGYSILKDITPQQYDTFASSVAGGAAVFNGEAWFFQLYDNNKYGLFKTDGTEEGTTMIFDMELSVNQYPGRLIPIGDKLYITSGGFNGADVLQVTDGTSTPPELVANGSFEGFIPVNGKLFITNGEPWITDGTIAGTTMLKDLNSEQIYVGYYFPFATGNNIMFMNTTVDGHKVDMWGSDLSADGTKLIKTFGAGATMGEVVNYKDKLYFMGRVYSPTIAYNIWTTDGTEAGTQVLKSGDWFSQVNSDAHFQQVGSTLYILQRKELWKTDGTEAGTVKVADYPFGDSYSYSNHVAFKGSLYFFMFGELWTSDGTDAGTVKVTDVMSSTSLFYPVQGFYASENKMYFIGLTDDNGWEVWTSDGTAAGTHITKDIHANDAGMYDVRPVFMGFIGDVMYFRYAEAKDNELWRTDGTEAGTYLVKDIYPGINPGNPVLTAQTGSIIYFTANDGVHGCELWKTDGTEAGTVMVKDIYPGKMFGQSTSGTASVLVNNILYFGADDGPHGYELWQTDGTEAGTLLVYDINPGLPYGFSGPIVKTGNHLVFTGNDPAHNRELWTYGLTVKAPSPQTITFNSIPSKTIDGPPFTLTATASSGLPVTFEIVSGPATISGNTVTITGVGTVVIRATQNGNDDFLPATGVEQTFIVESVLGLEENLQVSVWPNPATNAIVVNTASNSNVSIIDLLGREIFSTNVEKQRTIDVGNLPRGLYVVQITANHSTLTCKVLLR